MTFLENDLPFYYVPFSEQEGVEILTSTLQKVYTLQTNYGAGVYHGSTQVVKLFDWTANLVLEFDAAIGVTMIRYRFQKTFRHAARDVDELVQDQWDIMHDAKMYQHLHRVPVFSKIVQRLNRNLSVAMWNAPEPEQTTKYRNVSLFSRSLYQNPRGQACQMVAITGIPLKNFKEQQLQTYDQAREHASAVRSSPETAATATTTDNDRGGENNQVVYTHGGFLYTTFAQGQEEGEIDVEFGGRTDILDEEQGRFLMVELGGTCVRLEHLLFPFRVLT